MWILASTLAALALMNLATYARLRSGWPVTEPEFFTQLVADVVLYGCLLFQTGGATNPFIFLLLVPVDHLLGHPVATFQSDDGWTW